MNQNIEIQTKKRSTGLFHSQLFRTIIALFILSLLLTIFRPQTFFTTRNFFNVLRQASINSLIVSGITFVLLTGGIDLSVGSVAGFTSLITSIAIKSGIHFIPAILIGLTIGILVGVVAGLIITQLKVPPFITTLAIMTSLRGAIMVISEGQPVTMLGRNFGFIGTGYIGSIPFPIIMMLIGTIIVTYILRYTPFGRHVYAVGGNAEASRLSGVRTNMVTVRCYAICALFAAIAGMVMASRVDSATPLAGNGAELDAIAAAVIGGISLSGGKGNPLGGLIGALIIAVLNNGMVLMDVPVFFTDVVKGVVILFAVIIDSLDKIKRE